MVRKVKVVTLGGHLFGVVDVLGLAVYALAVGHELHAEDLVKMIQLILAHLPHLSIGCFHLPSLIAYVLLQLLAHSLVGITLVIQLF